MRFLTLAEAIQRPLGGQFERTHVVFDHHPHAARIDSVVFVAQEVSERTYWPRNRWAQFFGEYSQFLRGSLIRSKHRSVALRAWGHLQKSRDPFPS